MVNFPNLLIVSVALSCALPQLVFIILLFRSNSRNQLLANSISIQNRNPEPQNEAQLKDITAAIFVLVSEMKNQREFSDKSASDQIKLASRQIKLASRSSIASITYTVFTFFLVLISLKQLYLTRQSYVDVQRAFVSVSKVEIQYFTEKPASVESHPKKFWTISPIIKNSGTTPVKNLRMVSMLYFPTGLEIMTEGEWIISTYPPIVDPVVLNKDGIVTVKMVPPPPSMDKNFETGQNVSSIPLAAQDFANLPIAAVRDVQLGRGGPTIVLGELRYDDVFGEHHVTKYCFQIVASLATIEIGEETPIARFCGTGGMNSAT